MLDMVCGITGVPEERGGSMSLPIHWPDFRPPGNRSLVLATLWIIEWLGFESALNCHRLHQT